MVRFSDQMDVVVLNGKFDDPEVGARGNGEGVAHGREGPVRSQAADRRNGAEGHVHGMGGEVFGASSMRYAGPPSRRPLPSGAGAAAAPCAGHG